MRANFLDILDLFKFAKSLKSLTKANGVTSFSMPNLNQQLSGTKAAELVTKIGLQEIDIMAVEYFGYFAFEVGTAYGNNISFFMSKQVQKRQPICRLSEIASRNLNYVQAIKNKEFAFYVLKIQERYYKLSPENVAEMSYLLLPDSVKETLKQFGMTESEIRRMIVAKSNGEKDF